MGWHSPAAVASGSRRPQGRTSVPRLMTRDPPADGGYPLDSDLHQMTDDGGPPAPDPARWADPDWRDAVADGARPEPMPTSDASADWDWTPITTAMPPDGVLVDTLTLGG